MAAKALFSTTITVNLYPPGKSRDHVGNPGTEEKSRRPFSCPGSLSTAITDIPTCLRGPQYDSMIVYTPQHEHDMMKLKYILENYVKLCGNIRPSVCMYSCDSSPNFEVLQDLVQRTSIFFIYSSSPKFGDRYAVHKKDEIVSRCIHNPSNRIVPVLPNRTIEAPPGLKSLKPLCLDKFLCGRNLTDLTLKEIEYSECKNWELSELNAVVKLLNSGLVNKQERQMSQQRKLKAWVREQIRMSQLRDVTSQNIQQSSAGNKTETIDSLKKSKHNLDKRFSQTELYFSKSRNAVESTASTQQLCGYPEYDKTGVSVPHVRCREAVENCETDYCKENVGP